MKDILILGASGFTGKNIYEFFVPQKDKYKISAPSHKELDILDESKVRSYLSDNHFDAVINCLDIAGNPSDYAQLRLRLFANLYKYRDFYGKMIYFGSGAEYDRTRELHEVRETDFGSVIPADAYGLCLYYMSLLSEQSTNIYNFRLFGIFGRYERWAQRFISNAICKNLYGYPITVRQNRRMTYLDIEDLCRITQWAVENTPKHHLYNAGSDKSYTLKELAEMVNQVADQPVPVFVAQEGIAPEYSASCEQLKQELHIQYKSMQQSIRELLDWYSSRLDSIDRYPLLYQ